MNYPERERLPVPQKVYCLGCGAETYSVSFICGTCTITGMTETGWMMPHGPDAD
jgi:hypothetical protein